MDSRIVYFSAPAHGHIRMTLPVMKELVRRGARVDYYSTGQFRRHIEETGAVYHDYGERLVPPSGAGPFKTPDTTVDFLIECTRAFLEDHLEPVRALAPTCVMHDSFAPWGQYVAQSLNVPEIGSVSAILVNFQMIMGAATGVPGVPEMSRRIAGKLGGWYTAISALNRTYSVPGVQNAFLMMEALGEINIIYTSRAYQPLAETFSEERYKFVGPTMAPVLEAPFPFDALDGRPIVYITQGTVYTDRTPFFRSCIEAFRDCPWQVVMAVGQDLDGMDLGPWPDDFIVLPFVPQAQILKRSALFIMHGGTTSVSDSLWHGVPMLVAPSGADQYWNADRIAQLGAGQNLAGLELTPELLRQRAGQVLADPSYAAAAARLGDTLRAAGGAPRAADEIEAFLRRKAQVAAA